MGSFTPNIYDVENYGNIFLTGPNLKSYRNVENEKGRRVDSFVSIWDILC